MLHALAMGDGVTHAIAATHYFVTHLKSITACRRNSLGRTWNGVCRHRRNKTVATLGKRLNKSRFLDAVAENFAQLKHVSPQNLRLHIRLRPQRIEQLVVLNEATRIINQVAQNRVGLGLQSDLLTVPPQAFIGRVERE